MTAPLDASVRINLRPRRTAAELARGRYLADLIATCTMDARRPPKLPAPPWHMPGDWLDRLEPDVVFITPRCSICRVRDADSRGDHGYGAWRTCGEPSCRWQAQRLKEVDSPTESKRLTPARIALVARQAERKRAARGAR